MSSGTERVANDPVIDPSVLLSKFPEQDHQWVRSSNQKRLVLRRGQFTAKYLCRPDETHKSQSLGQSDV